MDEWEKQEKNQIEEYKKNPFINVADAFNRAMIGDWNALNRGGCLIRIVTVLVIISGLITFLYLNK